MKTGVAACCVVLLSLLAHVKGQPQGTTQEGDKLVFCYWQSLSRERPYPYNTSIEDIPVHLCTHLIYSHATASEDGTRIETIYPGSVKKPGVYRNFTMLKTKNPSLKVLLSIGSWMSPNSSRWEMLEHASSRNAFVRVLTTFVTKYKFDGVDLDWFPTDAASQTFGKEFVRLAWEIRRAFKMLRMNALLTCALPPPSKVSPAGNNFLLLASIVDYFHLKTYDTSCNWKQSEITNDTALHSENATDVFNMITQLGAPKEKVLVGIGFNGRIYNITSNVTDVTSGEIVPYFEVARRLRSGTWRQRGKSDGTCSYITDGNQLIAYEDEWSIQHKIRHVKKDGFAGASIWAVDMDDINGDIRDYHLLRTVREQLSKNSVPLKSSAELLPWTFTPTEASVKHTPRGQTGRTVATNATQTPEVFPSEGSTTGWSPAYSERVTSGEGRHTSSDYAATSRSRPREVHGTTPYPRRSSAYPERVTTDEGQHTSNDYAATSTSWSREVHGTTPYPGWSPAYPERVSSDESKKPWGSPGSTAPPGWGRTYPRHVTPDVSEEWSVDYTKSLVTWPWKIPTSSQSPESIINHLKASSVYVSESNACKNKTEELAPHEDDCRKYYYCYYGMAFRHDCPDDSPQKYVPSVCCPKVTHFWTTAQPAYDTSSSTEDPTYTGEAFDVTGTRMTPIVQWFASHNSSATAADVTGPDPSVSGLKGCETGLRYAPHENDTNKFYTCMRGYPMLSQCTLGSVFDPRLEVCNTEELVKGAKCDRCQQVFTGNVVGQLFPQIPQRKGKLSVKMNYEMDWQSK